MVERELLFLAGAYLLGGIPTGYLAVRLSGGGDIREVGSGNIGATNVMRSRGWPVALLTLLADMTKGALPVLAGRHLFDAPELALAGGLMAVLGHIFPLFLQFRGGKGVSPLIGALLVFEPAALLAFGLAFVLLTAASRYVSLGSLGGTAAAALVVAASQPAAVALPMAGIALLIFCRHRGNISRLRHGTERRLTARRKHG